MTFILVTAGTIAKNDTDGKHLQGDCRGQDDMTEVEIRQYMFEKLLKKSLTYSLNKKVCFEYLQANVDFLYSAIRDPDCIKWHRKYVDYTKLTKTASKEKAEDIKIMDAAALRTASINLFSVAKLQLRIENEASIKCAILDDLKSIRLLEAKTWETEEDLALLKTECDRLNHLNDKYRKICYNIYGTFNILEDATDRKLADICKIFKELENRLRSNEESKERK